MTRLWLALLFLLTLPLVATAQTGNEESICRTDPNVFWCENWEDHPLGWTDSGSGSMNLPAQFKNGGWTMGAGSSGGTIVNTEHFDGSKSLQIMTPANQVSGGVAASVGFINKHDFYWRMYQKFGTGYIWSPVGTKNWESSGAILGSDNGYFSGSFGTAPFTSNPNPMLAYLSSIDPRAPAGRFFANAGSIAFVPGQWYCMEFHVKYNTQPTSFDGILEAWVDGTKYWNYQSANINAAANEAIASFFLASYWNCTQHEQCTQAGANAVGDGAQWTASMLHPNLFRYFDNLVMSTSRIGCLGSPPPTFTLTTNVGSVNGGTGTVTGGGSYAPGTIVTPTAIPAAGSAFTGWSGACSGTGTCNITMDANKTVTATFGPATSVYPPSGLLTNLSWDFAGKVQTGPGSDLWPTTWLTNDTLLGASGDGGGANGTNTVCRAKFNVNTFIGSPPNFTYGNLWGCKADGTGCDTTFTPVHSAACDAPFGGPIAAAGEPASIVAIGNTLYANYFTTPEVVIATSTDLGHTWTNLALGFTNNPGDFQPGSFVQYGAGYTGAIDGFLYMTGGKVNDTAPNGYLARVLPANIANRASWQWFTGTAAAPSWGAWASATPFHADPGFSAGGGGTMQYFPGLGRFVSVQSAGQLQQIAVYEAPNPWGPWSFVYASNAWGPSGAPYGTTPMVSTNLMPKFITTDDATHTSFWMTFSGTGSFDSLNLIHGTFTRVPAASGSSENFDKANGALGPQMTWTNFDNLTVVNNHVEATATLPAGKSSGARSETTLATQNHFAQVEVTFASPVGNAGGFVLARTAAASDASYSAWLYTSDGGLTYRAGIYSYANGLTTALLSQDIAVTSLVSVGVANVLRLEVAGTSPNILLIEYLNGTPVVSASGQSGLDGNTHTGLGTWQATSQVRLDNFSIGDLAPSGVPSSCSQAAVLAAVDQTSDGATVSVPAGTCTWTDMLTINKAITLQGAGVGQTIITDNRVRADNGSGTLLFVNIPSGAGVFRLTGFQFNPTSGQGITQDGTIVLSGCSTSAANYRIDHNYFANLRNNVVHTTGSLYGVIDNNNAVLWASHHLASHSNLNWPRDGVNCTGDFGDGSWAAPLTPGTIKAHYLETNTVSGVANTSSDIVDSIFGGRTVVRYNTLTDIGIATHGLDSGQRNRSNRWIESYENILSFPGYISTGLDSVAWYRGGSGVFFNNHVLFGSGAGPIQAGYNLVLKHSNLRDAQSFITPWGLCDGTRAWDSNIGVGADAGYLCLDQPGAGTSADFHEEPNVALLPPSNQIIEPIYVWDNDLNGFPNNCANGNGCSDDGHVHAARDIIFGTGASPQTNGMRPGYTPFTYPHPLTGAAPPPAAPSNLRIVP